MDFKQLDMAALRDSASRAARAVPLIKKNLKFTAVAVAAGAALRDAASKAARAVPLTTKNLKFAAAGIGLLVVGVGLGYGLSWVGGIPSGKFEGADQAERKVLYWVAPMDPSFRSDKPGKSPMGMDLIPVYEGNEPGSQGAEGKWVRINPAVENNMGVRTIEVARRTLSRNINTIGFIAPNDEVTSDVHVRSEGWIENLVVKAVGERVKKGELLFQLYSRALTNAQAEYVQALQIERSALIEASRSRLLALGMTERQIEEVRRERKVSDLVNVYAPQDGYVVTLNVREGMFIQPHTSVFTLADLASVWVMVEVYEDQANLVETGHKAIMRLPFIPGKIWEGEVDYVYPTIDPESRTVRVRLKFQNPHQELKPNMYAEITIHGAPRENVLVIPREALIRSGKSERVILTGGEGRFRPAQVVSGMESDDLIEIVVGLREGERVVSSGQFLLDSEASLDASLLRMVDPSEKTLEVSEQETDIGAEGVVHQMKVSEGKLNITHDPIPAIGWPTMTMDFRFADGIELANLKEGDRIRFTLKRDAQIGDFVITYLSKTGETETRGGLQ